ncbi:hypothetical protein FA15DRAFT_674319 [Coprinopsis marcescibilis]|uniref:O-fucosyltransferase family protein n=1 Tax=Coprinopsis marcescibilis TaxID=230819 RepID=A0A5C3KHA1_COPMA|nr:hypothetical protein FA15DRAFT_674319 [Coprinopsis marcescibilis]
MPPPPFSPPLHLGDLELEENTASNSHDLRDYRHAERPELGYSELGGSVNGRSPSARQRRRPPLVWKWASAGVAWVRSWVLRDSGYRYTLVGDSGLRSSSIPRRADETWIHSLSSYAVSSLSTAEGYFVGSGTRSGLSVRQFIWLLVLLVTGALPLLLGAILWYGGIPRPYGDIKTYERGLGQHLWSMTPQSARFADEGSEGYVRFPDHLWGHGLNNVLEEMLVTALIAHKSNRSYVFEDYKWSDLPIPYTVYDFALRPTRIPLNAFVGGFIGGANVSASMFNGIPVHLSVSSEYYQRVCPPTLGPEDRVVLHAHHAPDSFANASQLVEWWAHRTKTYGAGKRCVEIQEHRQKVVGWEFFGSPVQIRSVVPLLIDSPVLKYWDWSTLVHNGVERRIRKLGLSSSSTSTSSISTTPTLPANSTTTTIPGLLAIHLRMGDYKRHCRRLVEWRSGFMGFALTGEVPAKDVFNVSGAVAGLPSPDAVEAYYMKRCLPSVQEVVERAGEVKKDWEATHAKDPSLGSTPLAKVLILSNGWTSDVERLQDSLRVNGWEVVDRKEDKEESRNSLVDSRLDWEERDVGDAIDMGLAQRADVFLGNGFSTFSGNIILLRLADGVDGWANRLF